MNTFILRRITSENRQSNEIIGSSYHLIFDDRKILSNGEFDPNETTPMLESFIKLLEDYPESSYEKIHAFILSEIQKGEKIEQRVIPLYCKSKYYIMTDSGKTFTCINKFD